MMATVTVEQRLDALTDNELLDELAEIYSAVLSRVNGYEVEGLDPDYLDRAPDAGKLNAGIAFAAMAESVTDHFLRGPRQDPGRQGGWNLISWNVGLGQLRNDLALKALLVAQGDDPREHEAQRQATRREA